MTLIHLAVSAALCTAGFAAPTWTQETAADKALRAVVDPAPKPSAGTSGRLLHDEGTRQVRDIFGRSTEPMTLEQTISTLLAKRNLESVQLIGPAAIPVLEAMTLRATTIELVNLNRDRHPVYALSLISQEAGLDFLLTLQQEDLKRFDLLVRSGYTPISFEKSSFLWSYAENPDRVKVSAMLDRALLGSNFNTDEKLSIACRVYEGGLDTETSRALINQDLSASVEHGLGSRAQRELFWENPDLDLGSLPEKQSLFLAEESDQKHWIRLLVSPYPAVRAKVLEIIYENDVPYALHKEAAFISMEDPSKASMKWTRGLLTERVVRSKSGLTGSELLEITRYYARAGVVSANAAARLGACIGESLHAASTPGDAAEAAELLRAVYDLPLPELQSRISPAPGSHFATPTVAAAAYRRLLGAKHVTPSILNEIVARNRPSDPIARAEFRLDIWTAHEPGVNDAELTYAQQDLRLLPKGRYVEALDWLGRSGPRFNFACAADVPYWTDGAEAFRASVYDESAPWKERATALIGLFSTSDADQSDAERCGNILAKELEDSERRRLFLSLTRTRANNATVALSNQWNAVAARVYAAEGISNGTKEALPLSNAPTSLSVLQSMLDAAAKETAPEGPIQRFGRLSEITASLAAQGALKLPHSLLANWLLTDTKEADLVSFILKGETESPPTVYRDLMLTSLKNLHRARRAEFAAAILRFPEEDTVPKLIDAASALNDGQLTVEVRSNIEQLLAMRQLKSDWAGTQELPTKTAAVVELLGLLKTGSEVARMEAMRGLGTLNAVEALPQLIAIAESGSEQEKVRAAEVLLQLNQRAMASSANLSATEKSVK